MKYIYLILTFALISAWNVNAEENIRGIFFENNTPHILGVRLVNRPKRFESVHMFEPGKKIHVDTKHESYTLSAQLITSSYPIDCCEWKTLNSGKTLIVEYNERRDRCYCTIK